MNEIFERKKMELQTGVESEKGMDLMGTSLLRLILRYVY